MKTLLMKFLIKNKIFFKKIANFLFSVNFVLAVVAVTITFFILIVIFIFILKIIYILYKLFLFFNLDKKIEKKIEKINWPYYEWKYQGYKKKIWDIYCLERRRVRKKIRKYKWSYTQFYNLAIRDWKRYNAQVRELKSLKKRMLKNYLYSYISWTRLVWTKNDPLIDRPRLLYIWFKQNERIIYFYRLYIYYKWTAIFKNLIWDIFKAAFLVWLCYKEENRNWLKIAYFTYLLISRIIYTPLRKLRMIKWFLFVWIIEN